MDDWHGDSDFSGAESGGDNAEEEAAKKKKKRKDQKKKVCNQILYGRDYTGDVMKFSKLALYNGLKSPFII